MSSRLYFSMVFQLAFKNSSEGVYIHYRTTGKLFNIKRFTARTKTMMCEIRKLLYADDCALLIHSEMDSFEAACTALGLTISLKKTVLMHQPTPGKTYVEPSIYVYGQKLAVVPKFVYLGSTLNCSSSIDDEVGLRISKTSQAFGILHKRLWSRHGHYGRPCLSRAGFLSHLRSHQRHVSLAKHEKVSSVHTTRQNPIYLMPYSNIWNICGKICKSVGGMKRHEKVHLFNTLFYPSIPNLFIYVGRCASPLRV